MPRSKRTLCQPWSVHCRYCCTQSKNSSWHISGHPACILCLCLLKRLSLWWVRLLAPWHTLACVFARILSTSGCRYCSRTLAVGSAVLQRSKPGLTSLALQCLLYLTMYQAVPGTPVQLWLWLGLLALPFMRDTQCGVATCLVQWRELRVAQCFSAESCRKY